MASFTFAALTKIPQWLAVALFALVLSLSTFVASFAEVPYSEFRPSTAIAAP